MRMQIKAKSFTVFAIGASLMALTACGGGSPSQPDGKDAASQVVQQKDAAVAAMVPESITSSGTLRVATDPTYAPFESTAADGKTIVGFDPDLANAIAGVLGLKVQFVPTSFDALIPALQAGQVDMALSSIGDTKLREKTVDFATYYWNGTLLLVGKGNPKQLASDRACGVKVGVIRGSLQQTTFLPGQTATCKAAGLAAPTANVFQNAPQAELALQSNRIDAVMLDAPPLADAAAKNPTKFETVGPLLKNPNPGGVALPKNSKLTAAVNAALNKIIASGTYGKLLAKWNLTPIKIEKSEINGALS
ncbi:ABC transporter substrate-binding protein [Arthrobacter dokdonensis]|uniref:ABC transporter substrate-binding protein n=1 Tax=Arthrobacter dokdonellae TaxID=2211210 RepID=UPI000DE58D55|nr:ABC transporter substrate-binding protein [Arthrobacter dokdonellae]